MKDILISYSIPNPIPTAVDVSTSAHRQKLLHGAVLKTLQELPEDIFLLVQNVSIRANNAHDEFDVTFFLEGTFRAFDPLKEIWKHPARAKINFLGTDTLEEEVVVSLLWFAISKTLEIRKELIERHVRQLTLLLDGM